MSANLFQTKSIEQLTSDVEHGGKGLKRTLSALDLTLLGIGAIIGTGIFVLTGTAAANQAGPAITMSYVLAGLACGFAALCYAEFASMIPVAGSAYTYAYATLGEVVAWMIGWDLILEYAVGSMTVAIGWSGNFQRVLASAGIVLPTWMQAGPGILPGAVINLPAVLIVLFIMVLLVVGVRESARFNAVMVFVKLLAVLIFLGVAFNHVEPANWQPYTPYGWSGVMGAAAVVFFAYIGFDAVSTTAEEAKNPARDLPIGIIASLVICTVLYIAVAAVLSGVIPVTEYRSVEATLPGSALQSPEEVTKFLNAPVGYVLGSLHIGWADALVSAGAVAGITSVLLVMLMSQPRIFFSMSRDLLLPPGISKIHPKFQTPYITTIITCVVVAVIAGFTRIEVVGEMTSIGTLFAFVVVCAAVIVLRKTRPDVKRPFTAPGGRWTPILGVLSCAYLMVSLAVLTWLRFLVWLDIGMLIYWFYSRSHSPLFNAELEAKKSSAEKTANSLQMWGGLGLFNGFWISLVGALSVLGINGEATSRWNEIGVSPSQATITGLIVLAVSAGLFMMGRQKKTA
ncbi:MAG: amino acid permease [Vicinamibacteria bacterium]|nr:amino acid permease [Vicinamibacteria bacterium]